MIKLYNDDCLIAMQLIESKSVDLILCDLPYGATKNKEDKVIPFELLWKEYKRIIKDNAAIILFGQGKFYVDLVNSCPKLFRYDLIWNKELVTGFLNASRMPLRQHEQIAVFYKKLPVYHPQFTEGKPLHSRGTVYKNKDIKNQNYGKFDAIDDTRVGQTNKFPTSILKFQKPHPSVAVHRTEKPIDLLEYLIRTYSDEGAIVLDNCMGAGSTGIACANTNRNFIGIELNAEYFKIARERILNAKIDK